jgi:uncharacterized protein (TIGR00369 family)
VRAVLRETTMPATVMTIEDVERFLAAEFPQAYNSESGLSIISVGHHECRVRQTYHDRFVRPGGTLSGPTMMGLADFAMYVAVLAAIGPVPLAVTINLNINFLRRPAPCDLIAEARLLKVGKRLAVGEVTIFSEGMDEEPVAHVTSTYSLPPGNDDGNISPINQPSET